MWSGWIVEDEERPDSDMPRATPNRARSNTLWAKKIDIERAWERADIAALDRELLYEFYGNHVDARAIAIVMGWSTSEVQMILRGAVSEILEYLNGKAA